MRLLLVTAVPLLFILLSSCVVIDSGLPEPIFTLPQGKPDAGRIAFRKFGCFSCHTVSGEEFPEPVAQPPVPIKFGALKKEEIPPVYLTSAQLAESIINPSHRVSSWTKNVKSGKGSRMGDFTEVMTVRELIDLVAFLQLKTYYQKP